MKFYAMLDGSRKGPFSLEQLAEAGVRPSTYVWCKGMEKWEKAEDNADICRFWRNRIYDKMHPGSSVPASFPSFASELPTPAAPSTFRSRMEHAMGDNQEQLPSLEEIERRQNIDVPPPPMTVWAVVAFLLFPPTGIVAIYFAVRSSKEWKIGNKKESHDSNRAAKMWTGITCFLALILYAGLSRIL